MNYKYQYTDSIDRQTIIDSHKDKILIEEQNITEGNFLIFSDIKPLENQLQEQQDNQLTIMDAIATIYEGLAAKGSI